MFGFVGSSGNTVKREQENQVITFFYVQTRETDFFENKAQTFFP
jgi:hypothetical protein